MSSDILSKNEFGLVKKSIFSNTSSQTQALGISIDHSLCNATISLYGGHVLSWQPVDQEPVFWMSDTTAYGNGKAIRGGIPVCFPWFGNFDANTFEHTRNETFTQEQQSLLINHGFARTNLWELASVEILESHVKIVLTLSGVNKNPAWDIPFELKQEIILGKSFSQQFYITNKSDRSIEYTGALHSYFSVSAPENTTVDQLSAVAFDDKLSGSKKVMKTLNHCKGPIDRIYYANNTMNIVDSGWKRTLRVSSTDCHQWVLWNPGKDVAAGMADVHATGENEYVCLEAANTQPLVVPSKSTVKMGQTIEII